MILLVLTHLIIGALCLGLAQWLFQNRAQRGPWQGWGLPVILVPVAIIVFLSALGTVLYGESSSSLGID